MSCFEDLSDEILMTIFEYMNVEDVWKIFFNMKSRINSIIFDSRLRLTADVSNIDKSNFDQFCSSLINTNFSNIFTLILSNNYYRYPQIRRFLSQTDFSIFQSLHSLTLVDINHNELIEVAANLKQLTQLNYLHVNTHEIYLDKQIANVTYAVINESRIPVITFCLHEKIQWLNTKTISLCDIEVFFLDYINADRLLLLLPKCPRLRSLTVTVDSRPSLPPVTDENLITPIQIPIFAQITHLNLCFRPFDLLVLNRLLNSMPSVRRLSLDTIINSIDYIHSAFWIATLQQLPILERVRLIIRAWYLIKSTCTNEDELDTLSIVDSYRCDRFWLDRVQKRMFNLHVDANSAVLHIR